MASYLPLTKFQISVIDEYRQRGFREGVIKTWHRLRNDFNDKNHYAINKEGDIARTKDGTPIEDTTAQLDVTDHTYKCDNDEYTFPTRITAKGQTIRRKLAPSRRALASYLRNLESVQVSRPTRKHVAAGRRSPPKSSLMAIDLDQKKELCLQLVFADGFRLPATVSLKNNKQYSWCYIFVDFLTKMIFLKPLHVTTNLGQRKRKARDDDDDDEDDSKRPASEQTIRAFREAIAYFNKLRKEDAEKQKKPYDGDLHVRTLITDKGSEWIGNTFFKGMQALQTKHPGFYNHKMSKLGKSQYNSLSERYVSTCRAMFYRIYEAYQEQLEEAKENSQLRRFPKNWVPENWHETKQDTVLYDWTRGDVAHVMNMINTGYQQTIEVTPKDALLENKVTHEDILKTIRRKNKRNMRGVEHNLFTPGTSASRLPEKGDFVRLKIYKEGSMKISFPQRNKRRSTKAAAERWSTDVYRIIHVKIGKHKQRHYQVRKVDPRSPPAPNGYLDRTQIQLVPASTIDVDTQMSLIDLDNKFYNKPEESESEDEAPAQPIARQTRQTLQDKAKRLEKLPLRQWAKLIRNKEFNWPDNTRTKVTQLEDRGSYGWVVMTKDLADGDLGETEFDTFLQLAESESWFLPEYEAFRKNVFD